MCVCIYMHIRLWAKYVKADRNEFSESCYFTEHCFKRLYISAV